MYSESSEDGLFPSDDVVPVFVDDSLDFSRVLGLFGSKLEGDFGLAGDGVEPSDWLDMRGGEDLDGLSSPKFKFMPGL